MPKGYGFIKFQNGKEAKIAKEYLNHRVIDGQEISIKYSSDSNRKKPRQMELINSRSRCFQYYSLCFSVSNTISVTSCETTFRAIIALPLLFNLRPPFRMLLLHLCLSWPMIEFVGEGGGEVLY